MATRFLNIRIPEEEVEILQQYCIQTNRTQTDVLREYVRSLRKRLKPKEKRASRGE